MDVTIRLSDEDVAAMGRSPFGIATAVHALVRKECRRLGGPGATEVDYEDGDGQLMREVAEPPGLLRGPSPVRSYH